MGIFSLISVVAVVGAALWYWLDAREKKRVVSGQPRHSGFRLVFASLGILVMLFSGGCGSIFLIGWISDGMRSNNYVGWEVIAIFTLPPLIIGAFISWLSMRRKSG
jgi:hypothetical protein